jgi:thiol:disulfide interchange protein DsbA
MNAAQSFSVETKMRQSLQALQYYGVDGTPTIIVAGKYRVTAESAGSADKMFDVVDFLVKKERGAAK